MYYREMQDPAPDKEGHQFIVRTGKVIKIKELSKLISTAITLTEDK
jgi:hypothetical protein